MKGGLRDVLIGIVILVLVLGGIYLVRRPKTAPVAPTPTPISALEEKIENQFNLDIPDNVEKASLNDVSGADNEAIATRSFENGLSVITVIANLPDPAPGYFYQAWAVKGTEKSADFKIISLGILRIAKGGYMVEYESSQDLKDYKQMIVSLEKVNDNKLETKVLTGSF